MKDGEQMPTLSKGTKSSSTKAVTRGKKSKKSKAKTEVGMDDQDVLSLSGELVRDSEVRSDDNTSATGPSLIPFSDGIVASCLKDLVVIPRIGGQEVELLRGFLKYFSSTELFLGSISNRLSFMKKKGGILL